MKILALLDIGLMNDVGSHSAYCIAEIHFREVVYVVDGKYGKWHTTDGKCCAVWQHLIKGICAQERDHLGVTIWRQMT